MEKPACLQGYRPAQEGPLIREEAPEGAPRDSTFLVVPVKFPSQGVLLNGWLYLPKEGMNLPLVILTNGGGNVRREILSLSNFMAPVLAHCGVAAFVHDKRGTGESEGIFRETDYEDYINDTGNAALLLSQNPRFDPDRIGVMGGSEGGRVAVIAASRFPVFDFVISLMGPTIDMVEDRYLAEEYAWKSRNPGREDWNEIAPFWRGLMEAFAEGTPEALRRADERIVAAREEYPRNVLPFTSREMQGGGMHDRFLSSWRSLKYDYVTEMETFSKPWLAVFGGEDSVVPADPNIREIQRTVALSGNPDVSIIVFPHSSHSPVDSETGRRILFENPILSWMGERGLAPSGITP